MNKHLCPITTLHAYEEIQDLNGSNPKTTLFLNLIGKHSPVTGSTIARWLKSCLSNAGIDTSVFLAHSIHGAAASKAASTVADILEAADWLSDIEGEREFCKFCSRDKCYVLIVRLSLPIRA